MATEKEKTTPAPAPAPEAPKQPNRFIRVAKVIIDEGENVEPAELALKAGIDLRTAKRCKKVIVSVIAALREAKLLPAKVTPKKAPTAPSPAPEPAAA
jgi:hypothetical protein